MVSHNKNGVEDVELDNGASSSSTVLNKKVLLMISFIRSIDGWIFLFANEKLCSKYLHVPNRQFESPILCSSVSSNSPTGFIVSPNIDMF